MSHAVWKAGSRALGREELSHTVCAEVETTAGNATQKSSQRVAGREITGTPQLGFGLNQNTRFACILANRRWPVPGVASLWIIFINLFFLELLPTMCQLLARPRGNGGWGEGGTQLLPQKRSCPPSWSPLRNGPFSFKKWAIPGP